jgi:hypothetical protein
MPPQVKRADLSWFSSCVRSYLTGFVIDAVLIGGIGDVVSFEHRNTSTNDPMRNCPRLNVRTVHVGTERGDRGVSRCPPMQSAPELHSHRVVYRGAQLPAIY